MKIINLIFLISLFFTFSSLSDETTSWELLKEGGKVVFIRHAYAPGGGAVSYTHLTLPTILPV